MSPRVWNPVSRGATWSDGDDIARSVTDSGSDQAENVIAFLRGWDSDALIARRIRVNGDGELVINLEVSSLTIGKVDQGTPGASPWPVSGTVTANAGTGTFTAKETRSTAATRSSVTAAATDIQILASNANRLGASVYNDADKDLYIALGTAAASLTSFTQKIAPGGMYEVPFNYTGVVRGIWATSPTGSARVTEYT